MLVDLHVVGTLIVAVAEASDQPVADATTDVLDAAGHIVLPGFIDVHIHGADGHDTMDADADGAGRHRRACWVQRRRHWLRHHHDRTLPTRAAWPT
ncbi:MAG: hypothetical protein R2838_07585 [Caldilineaceae bacterium]